MKINWKVRSGWWWPLMFKFPQVNRAWFCAQLGRVNHCNKSILPQYWAHASSEARPESPPSGENKHSRVRSEDRACVWLLWAEIAGCRWLVSPSRARGLSWEIEWLLVCNTDITSSSNLIILMHAPSPAPPAIKYEGLIIIFWMWLLGMKNNNTLGYINMKVVAELWPIGLIIVFSFSRLDLFIAGRN